MDRRNIEAVTTLGTRFVRSELSAVLDDFEDSLQPEPWIPRTEREMADGQDETEDGGADELEEEESPSEVYEKKAMGCLDDRNSSEAIIWGDSLARRRRARVGQPCGGDGGGRR